MEIEEYINTTTAAQLRPAVNLLIRAEHHSMDDSFVFTLQNGPSKCCVNLHRGVLADLIKLLQELQNAI